MNRNHVSYGYYGTSHGVDRTKDMSGVMVYHSTKAFATAPKIIRKYKDKDKVKMYECEGGRHFIAETYDKIFSPKKGTVLPQNFKGENAFYKGGSR